MLNAVLFLQPKRHRKHFNAVGCVSVTCLRRPAADHRTDSERGGAGTDLHGHLPRAERQVSPAGDAHSVLTD